ncbi:two-component sensor histidine kinase [Pseudonocardia sulfidoxydans NBRC 16205]|uniref:histidine kinase n=1 Tax=Pseudonocardia sulfidoxydans NBRC 16205 TaxID=1223511 RepID=A0A511DH79_9PSEU|nr:HAMP domain-containing sensor histidine kinase [Pseudonocardia sulfidoxydans]GEL24140.1 two-component sensor histidine kinase [Pseudonocardia sulfidoxydans NBRC 16205]
MTRLLRWWSRRSLRFRITLVVGVVAVVALVLLSRLGAGLVASTLTGAADAELRVQATSVAGDLRTDGAAVGGPAVRVVDTAGDPVDGRGPLPLRDSEIRRLASGTAITTFAGGEFRRWLAVPAVVPDGSTRLVVAGGTLVGGATLLARAAVGFLLAALAVAAVIALAAWAATRAALRPVDRMRASAAALPPGERLPLPESRDELRSLAEEINGLLARRDDAVARLERFTGDAAHELRSPVASIRAQAEVAVAHPDPALSDDTLRAIAGEAERLTTMLSDLLALARADAGRRPAPEPVDLVAAVRAATSRLAESDSTPVVEVVAPAPASVAAGPGEVALVLDNLLGNAVRYARTVVRVAVLPAGRTVRLLVDDDGPGVPAADRARIFDRFTRLAPEHAGDGGGAGLGLALVDGLVRARGGTVTAGAAPDGGARLEVRWPAAG